MSTFFRTFAYACLVLLTLALPIERAHAKWVDDFDDFKTVGDDGVPWSFTTDQSIVAVGDVHGDFSAFAQILWQMGLIDHALQWNGRRTNLVVMGDIFSGHGDTRLILDFLKNIQEQARRSHGDVFILYGNHDLAPLTGDLDGINKREKQQFTRYPIAGQKFKSMRLAIRNSRDASWYASWHSILRINRLVFVHGGLDGWIFKNDPARINSTARAWIRSHQMNLSPPPEKTGWVVGIGRDGKEIAAGPSHFRGYKILGGIRDDEIEKNPIAPSKKHVKEMLRYLDVDRMILGHVRTPTDKVVSVHPTYGDRVILTDSGISSVSDGQLGAVRFDPSGYVSTLIIDRPESDTPFRRLAMSQLKKKACAITLGRR